jgi:gliding motility-associated-like protein
MYMPRYFLFCFLGAGLGLSQSISAQQAELSQQVIGSAGATVQLNNGVDWSFTAGETAISTIGGTTYTLTQGFHQPPDKAALGFELELGFASCPTSSDGFARVVMIQGCEPPYAILWSNGINGMANDRLSPGLQSVTVTTSECELTLSFEILANPNGDCKLRFFNAFSPNGDGVNDQWEIENILLPEFSVNRVEIFNRWGQVIWEGKNYDNTSLVWDGNGPNGHQQPIGTYYYVVEVSEVLHKGYIELTR